MVRRPRKVFKKAQKRWLEEKENKDDSTITNDVSKRTWKTTISREVKLRREDY